MNILDDIDNCRRRLQRFLKSRVILSFHSKSRSNQGNPDRLVHSQNAIVHGIERLGRKLFEP